MTRVIAVEKTNPARKKGSGIMMGPAPRSKLIVVKAALLAGWLKNSLSRPNMLLLKNNKSISVQFLCNNNLNSK